MPDAPVPSPERPPRRPVIFTRPFFWLILGISLVVLIVVIVYVLTINDTIHFANCATEEVGVLVDGKKSGATEPTNDERHTAPAETDVSLGNFIAPPPAPPDKAQVIAFTQGRPPTLWPPKAQSPPINWTGGSDKVEIRLEDEYAIPVFVWIVTQNFDAGRQKAIDANVTTSQIWSEERQGIRFSTYTIIDATSKYWAVRQLYSSDFGSGCAATGITSTVGFVPGAVNIYYIDTVDQDSHNGATCGYVIGMGIESRDDLLAHELGHAFTLEHIDCFGAVDRSCLAGGAPLFDRTNVMIHAPGDIVRKGLTEGQTFRAIVNQGSAINSLYNSRPGLITYPCGNTTTTTDFDCPPIQKRIWTDVGETDATGHVTNWPPN